MIANNRKMYEVKIKLQELLNEDHEFDMINGACETSLFTLDKLETWQNKLKKQIIPSEEIECLSKEEIMANPYLQNIKVPNATHQNASLSQKRVIPKRTLLTYKERRRDKETLKQINSFYYCDKNLRFPGLIEGNTTMCWMTVEPTEIISFEKFINQAKGNILLLGCGLGYAAYMLSLKEEVTSITIVDINPNILHLFQTHLLPQFSAKEKITLIKGDALEYLNITNLSQFDEINVDIWRDTIDMLPIYLRCLEQEQKYPQVKFSYWLETELKQEIQSCMIKEIVGHPDEKILFAEISQYILSQFDIKNWEQTKNALNIVNTPLFKEVLRQWFIENAERLPKLEEQCTEIMEEILKLNLLPPKS